MKDCSWRAGKWIADRVLRPDSATSARKSGRSRRADSPAGYRAYLVFGHGDVNLLPQPAAAGHIRVSVSAFGTAGTGPEFAGRAIHVSSMGRAPERRPVRNSRWRCGLQRHPGRPPGDSRGGRGEGLKRRRDVRSHVFPQVLQNIWLYHYDTACGWLLSARRPAASVSSRQRVLSAMRRNLATQVPPHVSPLPFQPDGTFPYHEAPESKA